MHKNESENILRLLVESWSRSETGIHTNQELISWYHQRREEIFVDIRIADLSESNFWFYDQKQDRITNHKNAFFDVVGLKGIFDGDDTFQQPVLLQDEIGFLGLIGKVIDGVLHFMIQAKIEPGNLNNVQLSPTIQATKSNFMQAHGGRAPKHLDYFRNAEKYTLLVDQIQSEQSSRFVGKRNRNMIILLGPDESLEETSNFRWFTLGQIKRFMREDNMVNMDTRTVLSCIPYPLLSDHNNVDFISKLISPDLARSLFPRKFSDLAIPTAYKMINDLKMFDESSLRICGLSELDQWSWKDQKFSSLQLSNFEIIFCKIVIDGREVREWDQPLFAANGKALFALACRNHEIRGTEFLVQAKMECGCFDIVEFGPTTQLEYNQRKGPHKRWDQLLLQKIKKNEDVLYSVCLSEEGGRFYHEENDNFIIQISEEEWVGMPGPEEGYCWLTLYELFTLNLVNNVLNIQLRNLLSLLEAQPSSIN